MLGRSQAKQRDPNCWLGIELVWTPRLVDQQARNFGLALRRRQRTQVDLLNLQSPVVMDECRRLVVDRSKARAQIFVAGNDGVQSLVQHLELQFAVEPNRLSLVVNGLSANDLIP